MPARCKGVKGLAKISHRSTVSVNLNLEDRSAGLSATRDATGSLVVQ